MENWLDEDPREGGDSVDPEVNNELLKSLRGRTVLNTRVIGPGQVELELDDGRFITIGGAPLQVTKSEYVPMPIALQAKILAQFRAQVESLQEEGSRQWHIYFEPEVVCGDGEFNMSFEEEMEDDFFLVDYVAEVVK